MKPLLIIALAGIALVSLRAPIVGVVAGYTIIIMAPQFVWWWTFEGLRPFLYVAVPTVIGAFFYHLAHRGTAPVSALSSPVPKLVLILWACIVLSFLFGDYVAVESQWRFYDPGQTLTTQSKAFLFFFAAAASIRNDRHFRYLIYAVLISMVVLIEWANWRYVSGVYYGARMRGPHDLSGGSIYADENAFAMIFVVGLPFLFYYGLYLRNWALRGLVWLIIPFGWHAIFLTGSRGGIIGLAVTLLVMTLRTPGRLLKIGIIPVFLIAFAWQAGSIMQGRTDSIKGYEKDSSAQARFESWEAAANMIFSHPLTGVGVASFGPAFQDHAPYKPRVAHNTYLQIMAESGIPAGLSYMGILALCSLVLLKRLRSRPFDTAPTDDERFVQLMSEALIASTVGFGFCGLFISLQTFEAWLYLALIGSYLLARERRASPSAVKTEQPVPGASEPAHPPLRTRPSEGAHQSY